MWGFGRSNLVIGVLHCLIGSRHGAIGGQQDPQRPCHRFPATGEDRAHPGAETEHGGILSGPRLRKLPSLALQLVKQIERLARGQRIDVEAVEPRAQGIDHFFLLLDNRSEQR